MFTNLTANKCKKYNTKYLKIQTGSTKIKEFLQHKIICENNRRNMKRLTKDGKIIHVNEGFNVFEKSHIIFQQYEYAPSIVDISVNSENDQINQKLILDAKRFKLNDCDLCDDIIGIKQNTSNNLNDIIFKTLHGDFHPAQDETFLLYKDFIIMNNLSPYIPDHLMLITSKHIKNKITGSQYEILNREVLTDIVDFFTDIHDEYSMGHNYAHTGSQFHFHIHILRNLNSNNGMNLLMDVITKMENVNWVSTYDDVYVGQINQCDITYYFKENAYVKFIKFHALEKLYLEGTKKYHKNGNFGKSILFIN